MREAERFRAYMVDANVDLTTIEVQAMLFRAYAEALQKLRRQDADLERLAALALSERSLTGTQLRRLLGKRPRLTNNPH
jgi:ATP-dependent Zn protease